MIEDELLLCVPIVALHDEKVCKVREEHWSSEDVVEETEAVNPFAKLAQLKTKK